jgi:hypothetical protein
MPAFLRRFTILALLLAVASAPTSSLRAAEDDDDPYYETFFASYILSFTQSNLAIGITADAIAKKVYEGETAVTIATTHGQLADGMKNILLGVAKDKNIDEEDAELLKKMAGVATLLKEQADTVVGIAKGDSGDKFAKSRAECDKALQEMITEVGAYFKE